MKLAVVALALLALVAAPGAFAHASLVRIAPENGAVLERAPSSVLVGFDDTVRIAPGNAAVDNDSGASVLAGGPVVRGRTLVLPLSPGLADGAYSVRWSVVSDDGHREQGVLAFAVGAGSATPRSVLGASAPLTWNDLLLRSLYYLGLLAGGGAAAFWLLARRLLGRAIEAPLAHLLFFALLAVFLGGSGIVHAAPPGTRFALVLKIALSLALAGGAAAALAPSMRRLLPVAGACALALLLAPTLGGHALDRDQPRILAPLVDVAHIAAAAVWFGGLLALVYVVPRAAPDEAGRLAAARRFSTAALCSVGLLGATGLGRAVTELSSVSQVWSTSYGRALVVKTALFVPLLGLGWLNRALLMRVFARLRRSAAVEVVVIAAIVVAVAVLTELRPGTGRPARAASPPAAARQPVLPPRDAVVAAQELGALAVAVARTPGTATVTLLGPDGTGVDGRVVRIDGRAAPSCGSGCYRSAAGDGAVRVEIGGAPLVFDVPERAPVADAALRAVTRAYRASRTIVYDESLASSAADAELTRFTVVAPHSLAYRTRGGPSAIVIGGRRWDRAHDGAAWQPSAQTPLEVTEPLWRTPSNVHLVAPGVITFLDRSLPGWFRLTLAHGRPARVEMTAAAHFMVDRYVGFDVPAAVSPPSR